MKFVSYAQNFEDVILHRALKDVERGFYIDVGAHDPVFDSVTKAFYELGWRGINIEPIEFFYKKLLRDRPEDRNLQLALSDKVAQQEFFEMTNSGLSTFDETIALRHERDFGFGISRYFVPTDTLTNVCHEYLTGNNQNIHFLKIDVEGAEELTLRGLDLKKIRPWIILVESTAPMTQESTHQSWEPLIIANKYHFVYFDGLNRFYIADEHPELDDRFLAPPNIFDHFVAGKNHWLLALEIEERKRLEISLASETEERKRLEISLHDVLSSKSWRFMRPFRSGMGVLRKPHSIRVVFQSTKQGLKSFLKSILFYAIRFVLAHPTLKARGQILMNKFPFIEIRLRRIAVSKGLIAPKLVRGTFKDTPIHLSHGATKIYTDLKKEIHKEESNAHCDSYARGTISKPLSRDWSLFA